MELEAIHGSLDTHYRDLSGYSSSGSFGIGELFPGSDCSEGDVVGDEHSQSTLNLFRGGTQTSSIRADGSNCTMDDMVDFVSFQTEDLR